MTEFLAQYGYGFIALVVCLESTGLPLPGESLVVAAGMLASHGQMNIWLVLASAFLGSILGDNLGYWVGGELPLLWLRDRARRPLRLHSAPIERLRRRHDAHALASLRPL